MNPMQFLWWVVWIKQKHSLTQQEISTKIKSGGIKKTHFNFQYYTEGSMMVHSCLSLAVYSCLLRDTVKGGIERSVDLSKN